jgi:AraC family transcriptional regulator
VSLSPRLSPTLCRTLPRLRSEWLGIETVWYPPGLYMPPHAHRHLGVSLVLTGTVVETVGEREEVCGPGSVVLKPARTIHADRFGPAGATLLSLTVLDPMCETEGARVMPRRWRWAGSGDAVRAALRLAAELGGAGDDPTATDDAAADLLGSFDPADSIPAGPPPRWLARVRERLHDAPAEALAVSALAREAGVHPVYLTRRFRQHYGSSITGYRRALRVARARALLTRDEPLSQVALAAGFVDQSHLSRAFKAATGLTPAAYRRTVRSLAREVSERGWEHPAVTEGWKRSRSA